MAQEALGAQWHCTLGHLFPFQLGFALDDDDASCSVGTTSKEVKLEPPSTKIGVLIPLPPLETEDA
jgi:hypothetical protein